MGTIFCHVDLYVSCYKVVERLLLGGAQIQNICQGEICLRSRLRGVLLFVDRIWISHKKSRIITTSVTSDISWNYSNV